MASMIVPDNDSDNQHKDIPITKSAKCHIIDSDPEENNNGVSNTSLSTESTPQCQKPKKKKKKAKKLIQDMFTPYCITLAYGPQGTTMWTRQVCIETSLFKTLTMPSPIQAHPKCWISPNQPRTPIISSGKLQEFLVTTKVVLHVYVASTYSFFNPEVSSSFLIRNGTGGCPTKTTSLVDEVSTLHRHMQAHHMFHINTHILNWGLTGCVPKMGET